MVVKMDAHEQVTSDQPSTMRTVEFIGEVYEEIERIREDCNRKRIDTVDEIKWFLLQFKSKPGFEKLMIDLLCHKSFDIASSILDVIQLWNLQQLSQEVFDIYKLYKSDLDDDLQYLFLKCLLLLKYPDAKENYLTYIKECFVKREKPTIQTEGAGFIFLNLYGQIFAEEAATMMVDYYLKEYQPKIVDNKQFILNNGLSRIVRRHVVKGENDPFMTVFLQQLRDKNMELFEKVSARIPIIHEKGWL